MGKLALSTACPLRSKVAEEIQKQQLLQEQERKQAELREIWARKMRKEEMMRKIMEAGRQNGLPIRETRNRQEAMRQREGYAQRQERLREDDQREGRDDGSNWSGSGSRSGSGTSSRSGSVSVSERSSRGSDDGSTYSEEELSLIEEMFDEMSCVFDDIGVIAGDSSEAIGAFVGDVSKAFEQPKHEKKKKKIGARRSKPRRSFSPERSIGSSSVRSRDAASVRSRGTASVRSGASSHSSASSIAEEVFESMSDALGSIVGGVSRAFEQPKPRRTKKKSTQHSKPKRKIASSGDAQSVRSARSARSTRSTGARSAASGLDLVSYSRSTSRSRSLARSRSRSTSTSRSKKSSSSAKNKSRAPKPKPDGSLKAKLDISSNAKLIAQQRELKRIAKERKLKLDKLLQNLAKAEKRMNRDEEEVMETRRRIRATAAAINMQSILNDYDEENKYDEDDYEDLGVRIRNAFGDLGSVSSVARDVLRMRPRHEYDDYDDDYDSSDDDDDYDY